MEAHADARAVELAREGEARFRLLVEHSSDGLYLIGPDGHVSYASPPVERLLGFDRRELTGRHFLDYLHPDDRDHAGWFFADVLSKPGVALRARYRCLHRDGEFRHLEAVGVNRLADAEVAAVVVNFRDVTERRRAEQALVESEDRFRAVFESALVGIVRLDPAGRIADTNRAIVEMFGYQLDELRGRIITDFIHEDEREQAQRDWRELADGGVEHNRAERRIVRRDGHPVWVTLTASMVRDQQGHPRFAIAMLENITERKQTEAALQETNRRLAGWVSELEERRREIALLSEMGDLLRACRSVDEAYGVVEPMARQLFPEESGSISVIGAGSGLVETVAAWGPVHSTSIFSTDDCWALRRGRPHTVDHGERGLVCKHAGELGASASICVPLLAQGELLGVLHLKVGAHGRSFDTRFRFVMTVAEHVSLAIANLKLRETLRSQSIRDPLTGLFNRRYMEESLEREMRRAAPRPPPGRHHHARPRRLQGLQRHARPRRRRHAAADDRDDAAAQRPRRGHRLPLRRRGVRADPARGVAARLGRARRSDRRVGAGAGHRAPAPAGRPASRSRPASPCIPSTARPATPCCAPPTPRSIRPRSPAATAST